MTASNHTTRAPDAPAIRRGRKFAQVVAGARQVFLEHGFVGASVDEIARVKDVFKATLYSYFPDKRMLFVEVVRSKQMALAHALQ